MIGSTNSPIQKPSFQQVASGIALKNAGKAESSGNLKPTTSPTIGQRIIKFFSSLLSIFSSSEKAVDWSVEIVPDSSQAKPKTREDVAKEYVKDFDDLAVRLQSKGKLYTQSMDELKDTHRQLTEQLKISNSKITAFCKDKRDLAKFKKLLQPDLDRISQYKELLASAAADAAINQMAQKSTEEIQTLSSQSVTAELKDLGCTLQQCDKATQMLSGLKTLATQFGTSKGEAGKTFDLLTPKNKIRMARFCQNLGSGPDSKLLLKRAGATIEVAVYNKSRVVNSLARDLYTGDFPRLLTIQRHVDNTDLAPTGDASHRLDSVVLKAALLAPFANKEKVMIQHALEQTKLQLSSMKFNVEDMKLGSDGEVVEKIRTVSVRSMSAFKFDSNTVQVLLVTAKPKDRARLELLIGYAMILQDKIDTGKPMSAPASKNVIDTFIFNNIDMKADMVKQCVAAGFKNSSEVANALSFMTQFSARISSRPEFMGTMQSVASHPLTEITSYQAAVVKQSLGIGGIDSNQAAAFIQKKPALAQKVIESKGAKSSSVQDTSMDALKSVNALGTTLSQSFFAYNKGISSMDDRLRQFDHDTQKLETATKNIEELSGKAHHIQKTIDGLSSADLPEGVEIRHVRQFNNAELAKEEVKTLSSLKQFSTPPQDKLITKEDDPLKTKFNFSQQAGIVSKSTIPFKSEDMPSVFKPVQEGDKNYLGLFELAPNTEGHLEEKLLGYVDPQGLDSYSTNAAAHIGHSDQSKHSKSIEEASQQAKFKPEAALQKDRLVAQDRILQRELHSAISLKNAAEGDLALNMGGDTEILPTAQKSIRLAISELCRESLDPEDPQSINQKMSDFTKQIKTNPEMQKKISEKIQSWGMPPITILVKKECLQFQGTSSFRQWTTEVEPKKSANASLDLIAQNSRQTSEYRIITNEDKLRARDAVDSLSEGGSINIKIGGRWEVTTGAIGQAAVAAFTGGVATTRLTAKKEEADAVVLKKTGTGFRLEINETAMKSLGINTVFGGIASVEVAAGRSTDVGYHLDFDSSYKASEFLGALSSGEMESIKDASCLGMASAIHLSTGKSINLSAGAGIQITPPIPGLGEQNLGSIKLQVAGEKREQIIENRDSRTVITTTSSEGGVSFATQGLGILVAVATNAAAKQLRSQGAIKGENDSSATLKKSESVSVTHSNSGLLQDYSIKEHISCSMFGIVQVGSSFNTAEWITSQIIPDKMQGEEKQYANMEAKVSDKLDTLTKGNEELKSRVLELIHSARPKDSIGVERKLAPDTLFELNGLLCAFDEGNAPKSADQMKQDKVAAQKLIDTSSNYVITELFLSSITQQVDSSTVNGGFGSTGYADKIDIVQGGYTTLKSIPINTDKTLGSNLSDVENDHIEPEKNSSVTPTKYSVVSNFLGDLSKTNVVVSGIKKGDNGDYDITINTDKSLLSNTTKTVTVNADGEIAGAKRFTAKTFDKKVLLDLLSADTEISANQSDVEVIPQVSILNSNEPGSTPGPTDSLSSNGVPGELHVEKLHVENDHIEPEENPSVTLKKLSDVSEFLSGLSDKTVVVSGIKKRYHGGYDITINTEKSLLSNTTKTVTVNANGEIAGAKRFTAKTFDQKVLLALLSADTDISANQSDVEVIPQVSILNSNEVPGEVHVENAPIESMENSSETPTTLSDISEFFKHSGQQHVEVFSARIDGKKVELIVNSDSLFSRVKSRKTVIIDNSGQGNGKRFQHVDIDKLRRLVRNLKT